MLSPTRFTKVRTNHFQITSLPGQNIHHYSVVISPETNQSRSRRIFGVWEEECLISGLLKDIVPVYDGKANMYTSKPLLLDLPCVFTIEFYDSDEGSTRQYKIIVKKIAEINMYKLALFLDGKLPEMPVDALGALDCLLRQRPGLVYTTIGRSFYSSESSVSISNGAQLVQGFHQSIRPARGQMLINLDVSATTFYEAGPLLSYVQKILGCSYSQLSRPMAEKDRFKLDQNLKGVRIRVTHRGEIRRKYRINKLTSTNASTTFFPVGDTGNHESVLNYFKSKYNITLKYPMLPLLSVGDPAKGTYLPLEVCEVVENQRLLKKLNERQVRVFSYQKTAEMIKFTCQAPNVRSAKISQGIQLLQQEDNEFLREFNIQIDPEMTLVDARILDAPTVSYHPASKEPHVVPRDGSWNLRDKMVAQGVTLISWAVVVFATPNEYPLANLQQFVTSLVAVSQECGLIVQTKQPLISYANPSGNIEKILIDTYMLIGNTHHVRPQLIFCILPNSSIHLYSEIKRVSDTVIGIPTQCVQGRNTVNTKRQYFVNVCLKINVKMGGMNSYLAGNQLVFVCDTPTIVFGASLTHPSPGSSSSVAVASLAGSIDAYCARYSATSRMQRESSLVILELAEMVHELLVVFQQMNQSLPEQILFYRDGVNASQEIVDFEVKAIRKGFAMLSKASVPRITYVLVHKRHHTRFFPIHREDMDKSGNVQPGTLIDTSITHPSETDFYLCSHPGLQGTSKPTYYHILHNENILDVQTLEILTYRLCYLYCRATRSVSVCSPIYYAHLVATRTRFHLHAIEIRMEQEQQKQQMSSQSSGKRAKDNSQASPPTSSTTVYATVKKELSKLMYFM